MPVDLNAFDPLIIVAVAAGVSMLFAVLGWAHQHGRTREAEKQLERLEAVAVKGREILAAAPDGLFLWDHVLGGITISRRLAVLLDLRLGTHARYEDIRAKFEGESLKALERACSALRGNGSPFDLVLQSGERLIHAIGQRAETEDGSSLADLVWMRDITDKVGGDFAIGSAEPRQENTSAYDDRHLTALLDAMPFPVWLRDSQLRLAFVNSVGRDIAEADTELAERARDAGHLESRRRLIDRDGEARLMEISEIPLGAGNDGEDGKPGGTLGFALDRTERDELEGTFQRQARARDLVLETVPSAIAIFDADANVEFANTAFAELWGLDREWLRANPGLGEILERLREQRRLPEVPDFRAFKSEELARFRALKEEMTDLLHLPDGRSVRRRVAPHADGGLAFSYEDVSERLGLERSVNELAAVQHETLDHLHEGVAVFGSDGRLKLFNPVFAELWEIPHKTLVKEPHLSEVLDATRPLIPPPMESAEWNDAEWIAHKSLVTARLLSRATSSGRIDMRNGTCVDYANVPLPDGAVLLSYLDITDTVQVEHALRERAEAYRKADRMKTRFIADVSREVRTPLNTVIGFADMLGQEYFGALNPRQGEYAKGILDTSRRMMDTVSGILDIAAIDAGQVELEREPVDVHGLLVSALNLMRDRLRHKDLKTEFDCPPDIGWLAGDGRRLLQVLYNLLSNAAAFTPPRGSIKLAARREGDDVVITVSDTGVGIPVADREAVFQPFNTGGKVAERHSGNESGEGEDNGNGVGLGLTVVRKVVELHGGSVELRSQTGRGTTVICRFPAGHADPSERAAEPQSQAAPEPARESPPEPAADMVSDSVPESVSESASESAAEKSEAGENQSNNASMSS